MTGITKFRAAECDRVSKGALEALEAFAETLGLAVKREGRGMFSHDGTFFEFKVRFTVGGEDGVEKKQAEEFATWAKYYDLEPSDYGAILTIRGDKYKLVKINIRRGVRYPFECESVDGGRGIRLPREYAAMIHAARK